MIDWLPWGRDAFARARSERKPVFLLLHRARADGWVEALGLRGAERLIEERFVAVDAGLWERPDVFVRHGGADDAEFAAAVLAGDGAVLVAACSGTALAEAVARLSDRYEPPPRGTAEPGPAWTGATVTARGRPLDVAWPGRVFEAIKDRASAGGALQRGWLDALLYAGVERGDIDALALIGRRLQPAAEFADLESLARYARACCEAAALDLPGAAAEAARRARQLLSQRDAESGLFAPAARAGPAYAAGSAVAALALLRAGAVCGDARFGEAAFATLDVLRASWFDPMLGVIRSRGPRGMVYGLLEDNAWALLASTEAYLTTGDKARREFAVELARFLFQELWEREGGAFLDHIPSDADAGLMRQPLFPLEANAAAFEGVWRVGETTGNANYRRWVEMGLRRLAGGDDVDPALCGDLARVQAMLERGRADLELVGRLGDPRAGALLAAAQREYAPRRIVSFVDPDDQDYIQAHKLASASIPRLFACVDLRPIGDATDPAQVGALVRALR